MEVEESVNLNNEFISEVQDLATNPTEKTTPPPTQVEEVEPVNKIATIRTVKFAVAEKVARKLKSNWGRRVAKQQHIECNKMALQRSKQKLKSTKYATKQEQWYNRRQQRREEKLRSTEGTGVMDSGTMSTVICPKDDKYVIDTNVPSPKTFQVATGQQTKGGNQALLRNGLRGRAAQADKVPALVNNSLVATSKLADENYHTVFTPTEVLVYDGEVTPEKVPVWKGWRCKQTGLWRIPLCNEVNNLNTETMLLTEEQMNAAFGESINSVQNLPSKTEHVKYLHAALGFPTKETMLTATRAGFLATWPSLNVTTINKYFPESNETQKGHMKHQRKGLRSTKIPQLQPNVTEEQQIEYENEKKALKQKERDIYVRIWEEKDLIYTDQTGKFPHTSSRGHKYVMVMYYIDGSYIMMEPMKSKHENEMIRVHGVLMERLKQQGFQPKKQILDNEISAEYKKAIKKYNMTHERVPKDAHRRNAAEKAIQTAKSHIKSIIAGCDPSFPMHLWCRLLPQAELTCNLLRPANANPNVSAYQYVYGTFDYEKTPLHPLGCAVQAFNSINTRKSWEEHSKDAWHIGTSMEHHRTYQEYIKDTRAVQNCDTVFFRHHYITKPTVTKADVVANAANKLIDALQGNLASAHDETDLQALERLADIFLKASKQVSNDDLEETANTNKAPAPRVETPAPRVEEQSPRVAATTAKQTAPPNNRRDEVPDLIPEYDSESDSDSEDEEQEEEQVPRYNTRAQADKRKQLCGSVTTEAILSAVEMTFEKLEPAKLAKRKYPLQLLCDIAGAVMDAETGEMMEYRHLIRKDKYKKVWGHSFGNEIGRLAQGMPGRVEGTNTFFFIDYGKIPANRKNDVTYARICCNIRPEKVNEPNRTRITVGGDRINYPFEVATPTADLLTVKLLLNSVISTEGARFASVDIKNFYLCTPLSRYEYVRMNLADFPDDVIEQYNLKAIANKAGMVFVEIRKGMYGLPQAGLLAQELLEQRLNKHGYHQSNRTPGLWTHKWRPIQFSLVVDDFGIKYVGEENLLHLTTILKQHYDISIDKKGSRYIGITMDWDYEKREVHLSMPGYREKALKRFQHERPAKPQNQPYPHIPPKYGAKVQYAEPEDTSPKLNKADKKFIQEVTGTFLYYARAIDSTMLTALSALASKQSDPTEATMKKCKQFLDYAASQEDAVVTYKASDMKLAIHSDASYLNEPKARSRAGGHFFLTKKHNDTNPDNGAVLNIAQVIKAVMSSAAEAELGALFINAKQAIPIRHTLEELGHPQGKTPVQTDNSTANGVVNGKIQPKQTKAMDMRFYWLKDREAQNFFQFHWKPGKTNLADYWTKHHTAIHHANIRSQILSKPSVIEQLKKRLSKALKGVTARVC